MEAQSRQSVQHAARRIFSLLFAATLLSAPVTSAASPSVATAPQKRDATAPQKKEKGDGKDEEKKDEAKTVLTPAGEVRILGKDEARAAVQDLKKHVLSRRARGPRRRTPKQPEGKQVAPSGKFLRRLEEVEKLQKVQHDSLVAPLAKVVATDPAVAVRVKAVGALKAQPGPKVRVVAEKLLANEEVREHGSLAGPLIEILAFYGASRSFWPETYKDFLEFGPIAQTEICKAVGKRKDWDGIELLLEHLDAPAPVDVHDPSNPPAEYWKKRWEAWRIFKPALVESLGKLLGKEFHTKKQAMEYIESQGGLRKLRRKNEK